MEQTTYSKITENVHKVIVRSGEQAKREEHLSKGYHVSYTLRSSGKVIIVMTKRETIFN